MLRKTLTILSLLGLLISVGLWGVSYFSLDFTSPGGFFVGVHFGVLKVGFIPGLVDWPGPGWHWRGFFYLRTFWVPFVDSCQDEWELGLPLWIPALLSAAYPMYLYSPLYRRRKRRKLGLCVKCGYDLRGSKNRCPECGEAFESLKLTSEG